MSKPIFYTKFNKFVINRPNKKFIAIQFDISKYST